MHGIRPPHLGHQNIGRNGALGEVQQVIPQAAELFTDEGQKKLIWILEGQVLSQSELERLLEISQSEDSLFIVIEMGGSRKLQWKPLKIFLNNDF